MRHALSIFLILAASFAATSTAESQSAAAPPKAPVKKQPAKGAMKRVTAPAVSAKVGELIVLTTAAKGETAFFFDARDFGPKHAHQEGGTLILVAVKPGLYSVNVVAWDERKIEQILITVDGVAPVPPIPPTPIPPIPPDPAPPADPLTKAISDAYARETSPSRKDEAGRLANVYRNGVVAAKSSETVGEIYDAMAARAAALQVNGRLVLVQSAMRPEVERIASTNGDAKLTEPDRLRITTGFSRIAEILENLK